MIFASWNRVFGEKRGEARWTEGVFGRGRICLLAVVLLLGVGCGGGERVDTAPFQTGIEAYLKAGSMDMAVKEVKSVELVGDKATVTASLHAAELPTASVRWTFDFERRGDVWVAVKHTP